MVELFDLVAPDRSLEWAAALILETGAIGSAVQSSPERLLAIIGDERPVRLLQRLRSIMNAMLSVEIERGPVLANYAAMTEYLRVAMAHRLNESARVLHLNARNVLIRDEQISEGSIDQTAIYVREVARRALELGSAAVILVHNHPSGDPSPSRQDVQLTKEIAAALRPLAVTLHDHVIVAAGGQTSMRALGLV